MIKHEHKTFKDHRGSYTPINTKILDIDWTQCSISVNTEKFTFRGLHYQTNPPQTKYVKVIQGLIIDFMVDLETGETDYCMVGENEAVYIPNTKAHGFLTLEPNTIVTYMVEGEYNPKSEHSIVWSTNEVVASVIKQHLKDGSLIISEKDDLK
jgi:dTDP-4-dehydrorhamnose 3,5-epimerase